MLCVRCLFTRAKLEREDSLQKVCRISQVYVYISFALLCEGPFFTFGTGSLFCFVLFCFSQISDLNGRKTLRVSNSFAAVDGVDFVNQSDALVRSCLPVLGLFFFFFFFRSPRACQNCSRFFSGFMR